MIDDEHFRVRNPPLFADLPHPIEEISPRKPIHNYNHIGNTTSRRLERADGGHPLLDHQLRAGPRRPRHPQAAVITSPVFSGKRYEVLGLARSGLATVEALLASGAEVTEWDGKDEARAYGLAGRSAPARRGDRTTDEEWGCC